MGHYTYFSILLGSLLFPLILSFDKKVHFYKKWKYVFPAMIIPAVLYIVWDSWFTEIGVWSFNPAYIAGIHFFGLPVEEIIFFFVVPYCCIFIYECIRCYFPQLKNTRAADYTFGILAIVCTIAGMIYNNKLYTGTTLLLSGLFIAFILAFREFFRNFHTIRFFISYGIIVIPFLIVNGLLTAIPVVLYNDAENIQVRIYTIPVEDLFYGMLLIMMNVAGYEKFREWLGNDD